MHKTIVWNVVSLLAVAALSGCGGSNDDVAPAAVRLGVDAGASIADEQENGACASPARSLTGAAGAGGSCGNATDCAPVCCPCAAGTKRWSAAVCVQGRCADAKTACGQSTDDKRFCE